MKDCPYCYEKIQDKAIVCRFCGRDLPAPPVFPPATAAPAPTQPVKTSAEKRSMGWILALAAIPILILAVVVWVNWPGSTPGWGANANNMGAPVCDEATILAARRPPNQETVEAANETGIFIDKSAMNRVKLSVTNNSPSAIQIRYYTYAEYDKPKTDYVAGNGNSWEKEIWLRKCTQINLLAILDEKTGSVTCRVSVDDVLVDEQRVADQQYAEAYCGAMVFNRAGSGTNAAVTPTETPVKPPSTHCTQGICIKEIFLYSTGSFLQLDVSLTDEMGNVEGGKDYYLDGSVFFTIYSEDTYLGKIEATRPEYCMTRNDFPWSLGTMAAGCSSLAYGDVLEGNIYLGQELKVVVVGVEDYEQNVVLQEKPEN